MSGRLTIYGNHFSTNTNLVLLTLAEGGFTDYDFVEVDLKKGEQKTPEFLARNPHGKVPVLTTPEGDHICESRAMAKYVATRYGFTHLLPSPDDALAIAKFDQEMFANLSYFSPHAAAIIFNSLVKPALLNAPVDENAIAQAKAQLEPHLDTCDAILGSGQDFIAGNSFGLVDICYIPPLWRVLQQKNMNLLESRPNLEAWWARCISRPAIEGCLQDMPKVGSVKKPSES